MFQWGQGVRVTRLGESSTPSPFTREGRPIPGIQWCPTRPPCFIDISKMHCIFDMSLPREEGRESEETGEWASPRSLAGPRDGRGSRGWGRVLMWRYYSRVEGGGGSGDVIGWLVCVLLRLYSRNVISIRPPAFPSNPFPPHRFGPPVLPVFPILPTNGRNFDS